MPLKGRVALVTGASAGIGEACALALAAEGVDVFLTGRREAQLGSVAERCVSSGVRAEVIPGDITDPAFVAELCRLASSSDILINNAGVLNYTPLLESTTQECAWMFTTNVVAAFDVAREISNAMVKRGQGGHLVFITSGAARNVGANAVVYAATKHALSAFAKGFRLELKSHGIKVSEVAPGMVDTEIRRGLTHPEVLKSIAARKFPPLSAQDVSRAVIYALASTPDCSQDLIELRPRLA